jgi:hypothetical protein
MYQRWMKWLREIDEEIKQNELLEELKLQKKFHRNEVCYLTEYEKLAYFQWSSAKLSLSKAKLNYHSIDWKLAQIDGRYHKIENISSRIDLSKDINSLLKSLSKSEKNQLLMELGISQEEDQDEM